MLLKTTPISQPEITYQLQIELRKDISICVRSGKRFNLQAGFYSYTGSAKRGLCARVNRHLGSTKKLFWHIDFLVSCPEAEIIAVMVSTFTECHANLHTPGEPILAFGSTDCQTTCGGHLKYHGATRTSFRFMTLPCRAYDALLCELEATART